MPRSSVRYIGRLTEAGSENSRSVAEYRTQNISEYGADNPDRAEGKCYGLHVWHFTICKISRVPGGVHLVKENA
jgi:hypothetical protein